MKKSLLIVAVLGLAFASCKKDRVCSCKEVDSYKLNDPKVGVAPPDNVTDYNVTFTKTSLMTANRACIHTKNENKQQDYVETVDLNCSLK